MSAETNETPLQRAVRELTEQNEARAAEQVKPVQAPKPARTVQLVLELTYNASGKVVRIDGVCQGMAVLCLQGTGQVDIPIGDAAEELLRCAGLRALLGAP